MAGSHCFFSRCASLPVGPLMLTAFPTFHSTRQKSRRYFTTTTVFKPDEHHQDRKRRATTAGSGQDPGELCMGGRFSKGLHIVPETC